MIRLYTTKGAAKKAEMTPKRVRYIVKKFRIGKFLWWFTASAVDKIRVTNAKRREYYHNLFRKAT